MTRLEIFIALVGASHTLPEIKGKHRALLALCHALKLDRRHATVEANLSKPVAYLARLDLHSWLQRLAFVSGGYETRTVHLLLRLWKSHTRGYLLDIGANIGLISIPFALLARSAKVIAVEAVVDNHRALTHNIALNNLVGRVTALNVALGDQEKTVDIQVEGDLRNGEGTGTANIMPDNSTYECERIPLQLQTLDDLYESGILPKGCSIIKIDTDGYDLKILQGGKRFLAENRPIIFGEFAAHCLAWHGQSHDDVRDFAGSCGYSTHNYAGTFSEDLLLTPTELNSQSVMI